MTLLWELLAVALVFAIAVMLLKRSQRRERLSEWQRAAERFRQRIDAAERELNAREIPPDKLVSARAELEQARRELGQLEGNIKAGGNDSSVCANLALSIVGRAAGVQALARTARSKPL